MLEANGAAAVPRADQEIGRNCWTRADSGRLSNGFAVMTQRQRKRADSAWDTATVNVDGHMEGRKTRYSTVCNAVERQGEGNGEG